MSDADKRWKPVFRALEDVGKEGLMYPEQAFGNTLFGVLRDSSDTKEKRTYLNRVLKALEERVQKEFDRLREDVTRQQAIYNFSKQAGGKNTDNKPEALLAAEEALELFKQSILEANALSVYSPKTPLSDAIRTFADYWYRLEGNSRTDQSIVSQRIPGIFEEGRLSRLRRTFASLFSRTEGSVSEAREQPSPEGSRSTGRKWAVGTAAAGILGISATVIDFSGFNMLNVGALVSHTGDVTVTVNIGQTSEPAKILTGSSAASEDEAPAPSAIINASAGGQTPGKLATSKPPVPSP